MEMNPFDIRARRELEPAPGCAACGEVSQWRMQCGALNVLWLCSGCLTFGAATLQPFGARATENRRQIRKEQATTNAWMHDREQALERRDELLTAIGEAARLVGVGMVPPCSCCGHTVRTFHSLFHCYHCGLWLCPMCSRHHFGEAEDAPGG